MAPLALHSPVSARLAMDCTTSAAIAGAMTRAKVHARCRPVRPSPRQGRNGVSAATSAKTAMVPSASGRVTTMSKPHPASCHVARPRCASSVVACTRRFQATSAAAHPARKNATSIPLQSDQASAPIPTTNGAASHRVRPRVTRPTASISPKTDRQATQAAHAISDSSRNPTSQPKARTKGYDRLVLPDE